MLKLKRVANPKHCDACFQQLLTVTTTLKLKMATIQRCLVNYVTLLMGLSKGYMAVENQTL